MPDLVANVLSKAIQQEQAGQADAALATFDQAIAEGVDAVLIHSNRGLLLDRMGRPAAALSAFRRANVLEPNFRDHYNAGNMLLKLERFEDAQSEFEASISYRDDYPDCWTNWGIARHATGEIEAARAAFDRALQLSPDFLPAHRCLAILHGKKGRLELSAGHFRRVAEASPASGDAWFEYGCALYKTLGEGTVSFDPSGPEGRAIAAFDRAIALQPGNAGAWGRKIGAQFRLADAARSSDQAAAAGPRSIQLLPLILADLASTIAEAIERFPDDPWFRERRKDLELYQPKGPEN